MAPFGSGQLDRLMMLPAGKRLRDHGIAALGKFQHGREIVVQLGMARLPAVGRGIDRHRLADGAEIPAGQVEKMNRLFQHPIADALDVVSPAVRAQADRAAATARSGHRAARRSRRQSISSFTLPHSDESRHSCPTASIRFLSRARAISSSQCGQRQGHRLFQKQMPAGLERRPADFVVQIRRKHDVDDVELLALGQHLPIIGIDAGLRIIVPGALLAGSAERAQMAVKFGAVDRGDRPRMMGAPRAVADQTETERSRLRHRLIP